MPRLPGIDSARSGVIRIGSIPVLAHFEVIAR